MMNEMKWKWSLFFSLDLSFAFSGGYVFFETSSLSVEQVAGFEAKAWLKTPIYEPTTPNGNCLRFSVLYFYFHSLLFHCHFMVVSFTVIPWKIFFRCCSKVIIFRLWIILTKFLINSNLYALLFHCHIKRSQFKEINLISEVVLLRFLI